MNAPSIPLKRKILFLLVTVLIGVIAGLFIGEIAMRVAGPAWLRQFMVGTNLDGAIHYGSDAGWPVESRKGRFVQFKPSKEFKIDYFEYHNVVHTDEWGGRVTAGPKVSLQKNFIPVLGDSFAFGLGVEDKETFVSHLASKSKIPYLNLAAPGSSLPNDLDIIEFRHKSLGSPKMYLFCFYLGNDFADMISYYENANAGDSQTIDTAFLDYVENNKLMSRSYLAQYITHSTLLNDNKAQARHRTRIFRTPGGQRIANSLYLLMSHSRGYSSLVNKILDDTLDRLEELSRMLHFSAAMIILPDKHQTDKNLFLKQAATFNLSPSELDTLYPNQLLAEHLEKKGIIYVDITSCLNQKPGLYYKIDDHFTAAGHRVVADCIQHDSKWASILKKGMGGNQ